MRRTLSTTVLIVPAVIVCLSSETKAQHGPDYGECADQYVKTYGYGWPAGLDAYKKFIDDCLGPAPQAQGQPQQEGVAPAAPTARAAPTPVVTPQAVQDSMARMKALNDAFEQRHPEFYQKPPVQQQPGTLPGDQSNVGKVSIPGRTQPVLPPKGPPQYAGQPPQQQTDQYSAFDPDIVARARQLFRGKEFSYGSNLSNMEVWIAQQQQIRDAQKAALDRVKSQRIELNSRLHMDQ